MIADNAPHLLLLPAPPSPATRSALSAAYRAPLTSVLTKLKSDQTSEPPILIVALTCPILSGGSSPNQKTVLWRQAQSLLAGLYTIVSFICAQEDIDADIGAGPGSVDTRVVLLDHEPSRKYHPDHQGLYQTNCTTVLDLAAFASRVFPWRTIFHVNNEEGYGLLSTFLELLGGRQLLKQSQIKVVEGGIVFSQDLRGSQDQLEGIQGSSAACLGGTFDHLHPGHKLLLHAASLLLKVPGKQTENHSQLIVGISGDALLVNKKCASELQEWSARADSVLSFLSTILDATSTSSSHPATTRAKPDELQAVMRDGTVLVRCVNLHDAFGPTTREEALDALCVSAETRGGGKAINDKRRDNGWKELSFFEVEVLDARDVSEDSDGPALNDGAEDVSAKISSTAIRQRRAEAKQQKP